jgi:hypothetical protein
MASEYDLPSIWYDEGGVLYDGAVQQFDGIIFSVQMAFGDAPLATSPTWTDVTTFVRGFSINRGRNSEFTTYGPGTVSIALDNRDRRFDPEHTTGPYFGDLNPMVPVRVQTTYSGSTYTMFYGFVQGWPTIYNQSNTDAVASVTAIDATRLLGNIPLAEYAMLQEITADTPWRYWPMQTFLTTDGKPESYDYLEQASITTKNPTTVQQYDVASPAGASEYARVSIGAVGTWAYNPTTEGATLVAGGYWFDSRPPLSGDMYPDFRWQRTVTGSKVAVQIRFRYNNSSTTWQITLVQYESEVEGLFGLDTSTTNVSTNSGANFFFWTLDGNDIVIYVNAVEVYRYTLSTSPYAVVATTPGLEIPCTTGDRAVGLAHIMLFQSAISAARIAAYYAAGVGYGGELSSARLTRVLDDSGWPASWRDIETGVQPVGSYRPESLPAVRYFPQIDNAEQGALFVNREGEVEFRSRSTAEAVLPVGLFDDSGTDLPFANVAVDAHTVDAIRNRVVGTYAFGTVTAVDSASVTAYGEASESLDLQLIDDPDDAQSIVDTRLARAKDPRTRITRLDINVRRDPAGLVPVVAALDLSDDVTVSLTPTGVGDSLWRAVRVQGITHTVTPQSWDVSLYLAPGPVNTNGPLMILDDDTYGVLDSNKLG